MTQAIPETSGALRAGLRDRVLFLRSFDVLQELDDEALALLAEHGRTRTFREGETLLEEGGKPSAIHIVIDGRITAFRKGVVTSVLRRGQSVGLLPVLAGQPTGRAVAEVSTRTLEIPAAACLSALEENFSLLRSGLRVLALLMSQSRGHLPADVDHPPVVDVGIYQQRPRTLVERIIELRKGLFGTIDVEALITLSRSIVELRAPAGHLLWSIGEPSHHAAHIRYGRVRCTAKDGRSIDIGSDFTLGVMDAWGGLSRTYEARAETPIIYDHIENEDFLAVIEGHVQVGLDMIGGFARILLAKLDERATAGHGDAGTW